MVQIIIDTQKDCAQTIKQVIALLEQELQKKEPYTHPLTINSQNINSENINSQNIHSNHYESSSFNDVFAPAQPRIQERPSQENDLFSMFSNELPSSGTRKSETHNIPSGMHLPNFQQQPTSAFLNTYSQQNPLNDIDNLFVDKRPEPTDFEGSSRFAEFNTQQPKDDSLEKKQDFFKELEFYD